MNDLSEIFLIYYLSIVNKSNISEKKNIYDKIIELKQEF